MIRGLLILGLVLVAGGAYGIVAGSGYIVLERGWSMVISGSVIAAAGFVVLAICALLREVRQQMGEVRTSIGALQGPASAAREKLASVYPQLGGLPPDLVRSEETSLFPPRSGLGMAAGAAAGVAAGAAGIALSRDEKDERDENREAEEPDLFHREAANEPRDIHAASENEPKPEFHREGSADILGPAVAGVGVTEAPQPPPQSGPSNDFEDAFAQFDFRREVTTLSAHRDVDSPEDEVQSVEPEQVEDRQIEHFGPGPAEHDADRQHTGHEPADPVRDEDGARDDFDADLRPAHDDLGDDPFPRRHLDEYETPAGTEEAPLPDEEPVAAREDDTYPAPMPEPVPEPLPEDVPTVVGTYASGGNTYVMYSDGSIEAETPDGLYRFASLDELKDFIAKGEMPPKVETVV